jgi:hypothetical protein
VWASALRPNELDVHPKPDARDYRFLQNDLLGDTTIRVATRRAATEA